MEACNPDVEEHFTMLIYPFRHAVSGSRREQLLRSLDGGWTPWWNRFERSQLERAVDSTYFFLPFVREKLFPEINTFSLLGSSGWNDDVQRLLAQKRPAAIGRTVSPDATLRLTCTRDRLEQLRPLRLEFRDADKGEARFSTEFELCWVDAILFPHRIGFLVFKVKLPAADLTVRKVADFLYYIRLVHPPRLGWMMADWVSGIGGSEKRRKTRQIVEFFLQDLAVSVPYRRPAVMGSSSVPRQLSYSLTDEGQSYGQNLRLYTYVRFPEQPSTLQPSASGATTLAEDSLGVPLASDPDPALIDRVLYELATCADLNAPDQAPHPAYVEHIMKENSIAIWKNWQALTLQDNVVFLGIISTRFTKDYLPENIEMDYLPLYLLAFYQRQRLIVLSGELQRSTSKLYRNLRDARSLWREFIAFRNHYWFSEVTGGVQGTRLYKNFQSSLNIPCLYEEVSEEIAEIQDYYEQQAQRKSDVLLNVITVVMLPASILATIFGAAIIKEVSWRTVIETSAGVYFSICAVWAVWRWRPWESRE
ncbi:MAG TPA: hypothetical protein VFA78_03810 [Chloroflexota bacterium]|nr:hypothetical protein [Chloroflexota bacterium]